ncbi:MAG TPA: hypothetical protein VE422_47590 [Terriglobia bacterium]|nr:hypothetical protein [Terriglobia bacterium]
MKLLRCVPILAIAAVCEAHTIWAQTAANTANSLDGKTVFAIAVDPQNTNTLYAGTQLGVFKSANAGRDWSGPNSASPIGITSLKVDPQNSTTVYATSYSSEYSDGVYKSLDGGRTWTRILQVYGAWMIAIDPQNTRSLFVAAGWGDIDANPGIYISSDGGMSWHKTSDFHIYSLAIDPQNPQIIYAGGFGGGNDHRGRPTDALVKSSDGGQSWIVVPSQRNWPFGYISALAIDPQNPRTIYAGSNTGVVKSTDAGESWTNVTPNLGDPINVVKLAIDPVDTSIVYASVLIGRSGVPGFTVTTDGGRTWHTIPKFNAIQIHSVPTHCVLLSPAGSQTLSPSRFRTAFQLI